MTNSQHELLLQDLDDRYKAALNEVTEFYPKSEYYGADSTASKQYAESGDKIANINAELLNLQNSIEINNMSLSNGASRVNNKITTLENDQKKLKQKLSSLKGRKEGAQAMYIDSKFIYHQYYLGNWLLVISILGMGFMYKKKQQTIF